jgi:subtilisin family serine protease
MGRIQRGLAAAHGTFIAGMLVAQRGSGAPAICPGCRLLVRPIFFEGGLRNFDLPSATPEELADAIVDCVAAGARILNLSVAVAHPSPNSEPKLQEALHHAARRGVIVVAAAGNQGLVAGSAITRHAWVVPVAACDPRGLPMQRSNLGNSIARRGLRAPGVAVRSLGGDGALVSSGGTSVSAPFVTGTMALLWSVFPKASASEVKRAVTLCGGQRRSSVVPPLLDARAAFRLLRTSAEREGRHDR